MMATRRRWVDLPVSQEDVENLRNFALEMDRGIYTKTPLARWQTLGFELDYSPSLPGWAIKGVLEDGRCFRFFLFEHGMVTGTVELIDE